ncbi:AAA family ATPase [Mucilaginibacter sp. AW1-7]|uniref:AAA family ATPase n=1 Tax=Mucilaginibacter sp. AW1-7 TaxID=3349874 RepID=UPI003F73C335
MSPTSAAQVAFAEKSVNPPTFSFQDLVDFLQNFNETLLGIRTNDQVSSFLEKLKEARLVTDLIYHLYDVRRSLAEWQQFFAHNDWQELSLRKFKFVLRDGQLDTDTTVPREIFKKAKDYLDYLGNLEFDLSTTAIAYIPVLRTSRSLLTKNGTKLYEDVFKETVHAQYFKGKLSKEGEQIFTGLQFYEAIKKEKNGSREQRDNFKLFEQFIGKSFFRDQELHITAYQGAGVDNQEIRVDLPGERNDMPIQDLGDGVQAVINLLFPVFTAKNNSWIFIDEPELNLHPGFQNLFIRTLLENEVLKRKNLKFFINSHSNHMLSEVLLGGSENAEIYVMKARDQNSSDIMPFKGSESATLELLGVLNTSTLISNCSVWVEGVTDRLYFRAFLSAYLNGQAFQPIEGLNYTFIEYGGSNLTHYLFGDTTAAPAMDEGIRAYFTSNKIFLISDTDANKNKKHQYYKKLEKARTFVYHETEYPEIENLLPPAVLAMFLKDRLSIDPVISDKICKNSYAKTKLGKFLSREFAKHQVNRKVEAKTGGTLTTGYKNMLAAFLIAGVRDKTITWEMLSVNPVVQAITTDLYRFISLHNQKSLLE